MSLFIGLLAFPTDEALQRQIKLGVLGSIASGAVGMAVLALSKPKERIPSCSQSGYAMKSRAESGLPAVRTGIAHSNEVRHLRGYKTWFGELDRRDDGHLRCHPHRSRSGDFAGGWTFGIALGLSEGQTHILHALMMLGGFVVMTISMSCSAD